MAEASETPALWNENEANPNKLAHRQLLLSLASIHTTGMATTHTLYDLAAHPEYIAEMREEIESTLIEDGGMTKQTLSKFRKLESLMKESQRLNPPSYCKDPLPFMERIIKTDRFSVFQQDGHAIPYSI